MNLDSKYKDPEGLKMFCPTNTKIGERLYKIGCPTCDCYEILPYSLQCLIEICNEKLFFSTDIHKYFVRDHVFNIHRYEKSATAFQRKLRATYFYISFPVICCQAIINILSIVSTCLRQLFYNV